MDGGITGGHTAGERVVPDVERDEAGQLREPDGDGAEEAVEAEVLAREQRQAAEAGRDGAVEAVGLQRQHGEPGEVAQLRGDAPGELVVAELHHCTVMGTSTSAAFIQNQAGDAMQGSAAFIDVDPNLIFWKPFMGNYWRWSFFLSQYILGNYKTT